MIIIKPIAKFNYEELNNFMENKISNLDHKIIVSKKFKKNNLSFVLMDDKQIKAICPLSYEKNGILNKKYKQGTFFGISLPGVIISDNLSWEEFSRLNLFLHEIQGIKPVVSVARKYNKDGSSSHIIGYVSEVSIKDLENSEFLKEINTPGLKTGKSGLEKYLNDEMIGKPGLQRFEVNAYGKRIKELKFILETLSLLFQNHHLIQINLFMELAKMIGMNYFKTQENL